MEDVAALAQAAKVAQPVIGRVAVQMGRGKDDPGDTDFDCLDQVGPAAGLTPAIAPGRSLRIKPPSVGQASQDGLVWTPAALAATACALESDDIAQFTPVRWVEVTEFATDRHYGTN
jgi:hypothetical protein